GYPNKITFASDIGEEAVHGGGAHHGKRNFAGAAAFWSEDGDWPTRSADRNAEAENGRRSKRETAHGNTIEPHFRDSAKMAALDGDRFPFFCERRTHN